MLTIRVFQKHTKIIANFVFPYICSLLLYVQHMMLVNMILGINGCNKITFQGY